MNLLSASDLIKVVKYPQLPGKCVICGFPADGTRDFLDWGMNLDWYGAVSICENCAVTAGQAAGMVPYKNLEDANFRITDLETALSNANAEAEMNRVTLDNLLMLRPELSRDIPGTDPTPREESPVEISDGVSVETSTEDGDSNESVSVEESEGSSRIEL